MIEVIPRHTVRTCALAALTLCCPFLAASGSGSAGPEATGISETTGFSGARGFSGTPGIPATPGISRSMAAVASGRPASAPVAEVQGTIEGTIDGRRVTWYSVSGESGGSPYSSSTWMAISESERLVAVGGFATDDPPLESFEWDDSGMPASYGTYDGSVIALAIRTSGGRSSFTVAFPDSDGGNHLSYQPRATFQDVMGTTFMIADGTLSVTDVGIDGGLARAEGTFSGTFRLMSGDGSVEITDGAFAVEAIPSLEALRR